jgi:alkyldihydroxyacetonephosphate synthase
MLFDLGVLAESYETSVNWSKCKSLLSSVVDFWNMEMKERNISLHQIGYRISQIYHDGVCCYFYFGYRPSEGIDEQTFKTFMEIRSKLLDAIHGAGGSLSHHHGVGKKLRKRYEKTTNAVELKMLKALKRELDPKNIFAVSNLVSSFEAAPKAKL